MLYYSSLHPDWDYQDTHGGSARIQQISALLSAITMNHYRNTGHCFEALEQAGVILGCGGFEAVLIQSDPMGQIEEHPGWSQQLIKAASELLPFPLWYCFSVSGRLYILVCTPRLQERSPNCDTVSQQICAAFTKLSEHLRPQYPHMRMILSDLQYGESGIFRCFNNLYHAMEYFDFRAGPLPVIQLDSERQLHNAFIGDMSAYRQASVSIAEQIVRDTCCVSDIAQHVVDTIIQNSVPSMESVHHHIQMFMLTFTDYLGSTGLVDAAYLRRHNIVYRVMAFETESELRLLMEQLLEELRKQHRMLQAVGRQKRIQSVREYVEQHITEPELTVSQVSQIFGISSAQIAKQFRYYFGVSLYRFLQQHRFSLAQQLIALHPDWTMRQVATAAGYTDLSTMYRAFRQFGDITPGALKSSAQQQSK